MPNILVSQYGYVNTVNAVRVEFCAQETDGSFAALRIPGINGPLIDVTHKGYEKREQGLVTEVMGWCRKGKLQRYSSTLHAERLA